MNVFRDSTATLLDRIARLERENARLRRREQLRFRDRISALLRYVGQMLVAVTILWVILIGCAMAAALEGHLLGVPSVW